MEKMNNEESVVNPIIDIILYTSKNCVWCDRVKELCKENRISVDERDALSNMKSIEAVNGGKPVRTVPQIVMNGKLLGGYQELKAFLDNPDWIEEYKKEFTETLPEEFSKEKGFRPVHESKEERLKTITETPYTFKTKKAHDKT